MASVLKRNIPNLFTLLNLLSGTIAVLMAASDRMIAAALFVFLGIFFDFFDGFFARKLRVEGEFGKQLDSLADLVTSGVVPGIVMFQMLLYSTKQQYFMELSCETGSWRGYGETLYYYLPFAGLLIPLAAAWRLANFNIDLRQTTKFIGLPTPAFSILVLSLPLIASYSEYPVFAQLAENTYVLLGITLAGCYLMNAEVPLFSLKFKDYGWKGNEMKFIFLAVTVVMLLLLQVVAIPLSIFLYILLSVLDNYLQKK